MKSHLLKDRILLFTPEKEETIFGSSGTAFSAYNGGAAVAAQRLRMSGREASGTGEAFADYRAEYIVNLGHPVASGWRCTDAETGVGFTVTAVFPDRGNRLLRLYCERLND